MARVYTMRYVVPINPGDDETVTADIVTLVGTRKKIKRLFRRYLKVRYHINNPRKFIKALGFEELL